MTSPMTTRTQPNTYTALAGARSVTTASIPAPSVTSTTTPNPVFMVGDTARGLGNTLRGANQVQGHLNELMGGKIPPGVARTGQAASRILPFTDAAAAMADVARSQTRALNDFAELQRVLSDPASTSALRIAATARATQSASDFIRKQDTLLKNLSAADDVLLANNPAYAKLTQDTRQMKAVKALGRMSSGTMSRLMKAAEVGGSMAGLTLSAIAFPKLVRAVGDSYDKLHTAFQDPGATEDQRMGAVADLGRATASSIHAVEGMRLSFSTLSRVAGSSRLLGSAVTKVASTRLVNFSSTFLGRAMGVLMPIADIGMFAANGVKAWQTLKDESSTFGAKFRSILAVGLDGLKLATYLLPMTQGLRMAYLGASIASLSLATWDFGRSALPTVKKVGSVIVDAVMHPKETLQRVANAAQEGVMTVARGIKEGASAIWNAFKNPTRTIDTAKEKVSGLVEGSREVAATLGEAARFVDRKAGEGIMSIRRAIGAAPKEAAPVEPAPVTPVLTAPASTAPVPSVSAMSTGFAPIPLSASSYRGGRILGTA